MKILENDLMLAPTHGIWEHAGLPITVGIPWMVLLWKYWSKQVEFVLILLFTVSFFNYKSS